MEQYKETPYGIKVKMCCASCVHASIMTDELRKCGLTNEYKHPSDMCIAWEVKRKLMNAGKGGGLIRSKEKIIASQEKKIAEGKLKISYTQIKMNGEMRGSKNEEGSKAD